MSRPLRPELQYADREARRFVRYQHSVAKPLGLPTMAAFAREMSRGTVSLAPTPEDPEMDRVGAFVCKLPDIERRVFFLNYDDGQSLTVKAHGLSMTIHRFRRKVDRILTTLSGYLMH